MTTMSKSEFARHINVRPGYVTQLFAAGRLVMDGKKVVVEDSIQRIAETRDPARAAVAERHRREREAKKNPPPAPPETEKKDEMAELAGSAYQQAKAFRAKYDALIAKREYDLAMKKLLPTDEVRQSVLDGDIIVRTRLESLPDQLAPQLAAESDEQRIRAILIEQIEYLLNDLSSSFHKLVGA